MRSLSFFATARLTGLEAAGLTCANPPSRSHHTTASTSPFCAATQGSAVSPQPRRCAGCLGTRPTKRVSASRERHAKSAQYVEDTDDRSTNALCLHPKGPSTIDGRFRLVAMALMIGPAFCVDDVRSNSRSGSPFRPFGVRAYTRTPSVFSGASLLSTT